MASFDEKVAAIIASYSSEPTSSSKPSAKSSSKSSSNFPPTQSDRERYIGEFNQYPKHYPWPREMLPPEQLVDAGFRWKHPAPCLGWKHPVICGDCSTVIDWSTVNEHANRNPLGFHIFSSPSCPRVLRIQEKEHAFQRQRLAEQQEQARQAEISRQQVEFSRRQAQMIKEQAEKAEYERIQKPIRARQKAFAQINQMHAEFRFQHPYECKRCPERFSSNSQLHRHIDTHHTKKTVETPPVSRPASPAPQAPTQAPPSPPSTAKPAPSPINSPVLPPIMPEKPSFRAQTVENAPPTPPQTPPRTPTPSPYREISAPASKSPAKTAIPHETSPRIYLPPHKRAYMTIAQLFTKFGSTWNSACSKSNRPIRKLDPTAPVWTPSNASKLDQSGSFKSNCTSASAFSTVSTKPASLPPKPPRQQLFVHPYWPASSPPRR